MMSRSLLSRHRQCPSLLLFPIADQDSGSDVKKHLFYSLLGVFLFTAVTTLLAVAGFLQIEEHRLDLLLMMLLGEVAVVVIILFGWTLFFRESPSAKAPKMSQARNVRPPVNAPGATMRRTLPLVLDRSPPKQARLAGAPERVALTAPGFFKVNARLKDRQPEWERWAESLSGKQVIWHGTLEDIRGKGDGVLMSMSVCSIVETFFVTAGPNLAGVVTSFQKGDFLKVEGVFQAVKGKPNIHAISVNRLDSF